MTSLPRSAHWLSICALASFVAACGEPTVADTVPLDQLSPVASQAGLGSSIDRDLASLRRATAAFHRFDVASAAKWSTQITPCMSDPSAGAMGFHYGNVDLIDGTARVEEPELLLYEPEKNGQLRLVGVEYIIPYAYHSRESAPPELFGQKFAQVDVFQLWGLHAWVWKENPSGMFAPWNPKVTCDNATASMTMSH